MMNTKKTYLAVYDYGMGGVWVLIDAFSKEQIEKKHPKLIAFEDKPEWMSNNEKDEYIKSIEKVGYHWDIEKPATGWLKDLDNAE